MLLIDTHCHLNDKEFAPDFPAVLDRAAEAGVRYLLNVGFDIPSSQKAVEMAQKYPQLRAAVGIHPHDADTATDVALAELQKLAKHPGVIAWGEIGLDYYYDNSPRDKQRQVFREQLRLARAADLPVSIHSREATKDTLNILREEQPVRGIMHCFSGSRETAQICLDLGLYIAFGGAITFKNAHRLRQVVAWVPLERLLLETDCPYLTPVPYRGRRNEPAYIRFVAEKVAEIKQCPVEKVAEVTTNNACRVLGLPGIDEWQYHI